jgi:four helix bundle protein
MSHEDLDRLQDRTKQFTVSVIRFCEQFEDVRLLRRVIEQLTGAAGSVGSNHRAMRRARSRREFAAKLCIVVEESDESVFWLEVIEAIRPAAAGVTPLLTEAREIRAIFAKARATVREQDSSDS